MKQLVSYKGVRILSIIEATQWEGSITIESIQDLNRCSKNTAYADVLYLESKWGSLLEMEVAKTSITVKNNGVHDFMKIKREIYQEEIAFRLLLNIFFNAKLTIIDHAIDLDYSESHLRKIINQLNEFLGKFDSQIYYTEEYFIAIKTNNPLQLHYAIAEIVKMSGDLSVFPELADDDLVSTRSLFTVSQLKMIEPMLVDFHLILRVGKYRIQQGLLSADELQHSYDEAILLAEDPHLNQLYSAEFENQFGDFIRNLEAEDEESTKQFKQTLYIILLWIKIFPQKIDLFMNRYTLFLNEFNKQNQYFRTIFDDNFHGIGTALDLNLEDYHGEIIFYIYNHLRSIRVYKKLTIAVYSDLGTYHAKSLIKFLSKYFSLQTFVVYDPDEIYEIILTTSKTNFADTKHRASLQTISDIPNERDIQNVFTLIQNY